MAAYTKQSINLGGIADDGTGDGFRSGGTKINDNFDVLFNAFTIDSTTFDVTFSGDFAGPLNVIDATPSTSITTGSGIFAGGLAIAENMHAGGNAIIGGVTGNTLFANDKFIQVGSTTTGDRFGYELFENDGVNNHRASYYLDAGTAEVTWDTARSAGAAAKYVWKLGGVQKMQLDATGTLILVGDMDPTVTETQDIGSVTFEWDNIFLQNAPTVSDKRKKNDLGSAETLIPLMKKLDPRIFSRKSKIVKEAISEKIRQRQKTETIQEKQTSIKIIDGKPIQITKLVDVIKPIFKTMTIHDEDGKIVKKTVPELDKEGNPTGKIITRSVTHQIPIMEDYTIPAEDEIIVSHGRPHTGFMAQDVKQTMIDAGIEDWAGYAYHNDNGEDTHVLRLLEFIAPMLAYIQELENRIEKLEGK